jgi:hypothetical protein
MHSARPARLTVTSTADREDPRVAELAVEEARKSQSPAA